MGVISPYKTFTLDGESSSDYGVYLTGEGVFNAPERSVEMVEIPGRNGSFALDKGKFENISVTYRVGMFDDDEENFADKVSAFRNWICSKVGYVRLSDDYNPSEYRMAVYSGGLEVDHDFLIAGEAEITFNCKPQRWLTSGETEESVADGGTLDNPTLFEASPLLAVKGYGSIDIGGQEISVENVPYGLIVIGKQYHFTTGTFPRTLDVSNVNNGDSIIVNCTYEAVYAPTTSKYSPRVLNVVGTNCTATTSGAIKMHAEMNTATFTKGTSGTQTCSATYDVKVTNNTNHSTTTTSCTWSLTVSYNGNATLTLTASISPSTVSNTQRAYQGTLADVMADSTKSALGNPMYIDLDIGECWNEDGGTPVSVNNAVALGSDLPKLPPGQTTFNYDNTITYFKVTPRWWKV